VTFSEEDDGTQRKIEALTGDITEVSPALEYVAGPGERVEAQGAHEVR